MKKRFIVLFVLSYLAWILLMPLFSIEYLLAGIAVSAIVGRIFGQYSFEGVSRDCLDPRRWIYFLIYLVELVKGVLLAGIMLARTILRKDMSIQPGVVAIPTRLRKRWELTLLANSITLTPGTFFLDMDEDKHVMYIHWISIRSESVDEMKRMISERYERIISKVFE